MDASGVTQLLFLIFLVFLSGFFSSAETALTTANRVKLRSLEEEGDKRAARTNKILENYGKMLSSILIGNNIVNLSASALATTLAMQISLPVGVATGILTVVVLITGEIVPKTWAMHYADRIALSYSFIVLTLMQVLTPVIFIIDKMSGVFLKLMGIRSDEKLSTMTEAELRTYVEVSHEDGVIETEEREMIYNVFDFSDAVAKDIMIPRINMVSVNVESSYEKILSVFRESMYTRLPVYQEEKDNIIGLVNIKDFILTKPSPNFKVRDILREAHYTYEYKKVADLLMEIREKTTNVTFVLDEYGATVGMITLEDLLEEIVGEIRDEYDADEENLIQKKDDHTYLLEGSLKLDDINDELGTNLTSEDYDSVSGLIIECLDRLPKDNEEVMLPDGTKLKVQGISQNRIRKVLLTLPPTPSEKETAQDQE